MGRLRAALGDRVDIIASGSLDELPDLCRELAGRGVRQVAILGGDGTISRSVTALRAAYGESMPDLALLGGGTMNTLSRSLGTRVGPVRAARIWIAHIQGVQLCAVVSQPTLRVDGDRVGMLFGTGLFARYIQDYDAGRGGVIGAAWVLLRAVGSALVGGSYARRLTARTPAQVWVDGVEVARGSWLVAAAGVIPAVGLGFRPFAACRSDPDGFAFLVIGCSPFALALRMHRAYLGLPLRHPDVVEGVGREVRLLAEEPGPYMMDGDVSQTGPITTLTAGPPLSIIRLDSPVA